MNILHAIAQTREIEPSLRSAVEVDPGPHQVVRLYLDDAPDPALTPWQNLLAKNERARLTALRDGYDALLLQEDDIIAPRDGLQRLLALDADIAYGLTVWRRPPHHWSAGLVTGPSDGEHVTADMRPDVMRGLWGRAAVIDGCGLFFTLIRRPVLEAIPFRLDGWRAADFYFAVDAKRHGFTQMVDTRVLCGHVMDGPPWRVVWPDGAMRYWVQETVA